MYERLNQLQGHQIPVYLGHIDLERSWHDFYVEIALLLMLSYGGRPFDNVTSFHREMKHFQTLIAGLNVKRGGPLREEHALR